ncbi:hypothetical protein [Streptomyces sp. NBC_01615]|uniref:hypothetical protein n=1 Tax=Streptomyces sp. NBC_01615 TaxID=2975898 RepID=UPI0038706C4B
MRGEGERMGVVRILLPLPRALARVSPRVGGPLLGAALLRCLTPGWVWMRPQPPARRLAWSAEAVAAYRVLLVGEHPRLRDRDGLARSLAVYANALSLAGRHQDALMAADESLTVPGARTSRAQAASVLHTRAQTLTEAGPLEEALEAARECVAAYRHAVPRRRDRPLGTLAGALRTYALVLGGLGRAEESVAVYEECAGLLRDMSFRQRQHVQLVRPRVLVELTGGLRALGRYGEAVEVGAEAREATDEFPAWIYPEIMLPLRARLLTDLARCQELTGDLPRARETAEQAVAVSRTLAERNAAIGEPWLVEALECLAHHLGRLKETGEERLALRELADLCTRLTVSSPEVYEPRLAQALDDLAFCCEAEGADREAVEAGEQSVAAYRSAAEHSPQTYEPELARALANLTNRYYGTGSPDAAVAAGREALAITRRLAESDWDTYQPLTPRRLRVLARALRHAGDDAGALACYEEAETILRELMEGTDPERYETGLAVTLAALATTLRTAAKAHLTGDRVDEAVTALRSLLALTRRTDQTDVHAACLTAFAVARAQAPDEVRSAWQRVTADPYPSFVYRIPAAHKASATN